MSIRAMLCMAALVAGSALAQTAGPAASGEQQQGPAAGTRRGMMRGAGMMGKCHMHSQENMNAMNVISKQVEEARTSNDPAKMRLALDAVAKHMTEMKASMGQCMQNMQGGGMQQRRGQGAGPHHHGGGMGPGTQK